MPEEILSEELKEKTVLDLTGCKVEELLYYVSKNTPVLAMTGKNQAVLITGYSSSNINYYDMSSNVTRSMTYGKADEWFAENGSIFLAYIN